MKLKVLSIVFIISSVMLLLCAGYIVYDNFRLNSVIQEQNMLIKRMNGNDTDYLKNSKVYKDSIEKFTSQLSFMINGNNMNSEQFIKGYDRLNDEKDSLQKELKNLKFIYGFVKETYGIKVVFSETDSNKNVSIVPYTRADSARVALRFFQDRLKRTKNGWEIDTTGPKDIKEVQEKLRKIVRDSNNSLDSANKN